MSDSNKILAGIVAGVFVICVAIIGIVNTTRKNNVTTVRQETTVSVLQTTQTTVPSIQSTTAAITTVQSTATPQSTTDSYTYLKEALVGSWSDSAGMSGYEFLADGSVKMTYVNLAAFNIPLDGKADGVYILEGNKLTIKFSIYSATIENSYTINIDGKILTMYNLDEHETSTYTRVSAGESITTAVTTQTVVADNAPDGIVGTWRNANGTVTYTFDASGKLTAVICNADGTECTTSEGIYLSQEDSLVIQYTRQGNSTTKSYRWSIVSGVLTLTDENNQAEMFTRQESSQPQQEVTGVEALYGEWSDSAQMSGYEFLSGGTVNVKYVDFTIPVLNIPISTTVPGAYTVNGDEVTVTHSIYGATISNTYRFSVKDNVLTLVNTDDGNTSTYIKKDR